MSSESLSPKPLERQPGIEPSFSPTRFNDASEENPLPRRIINPRSITQRRVPTPPNLLALNDWRILQEINRGRLLTPKDANAAFRGRTELPRRVSPSHRNAVSISNPFEPFRKSHSYYDKRRYNTYIR